MTQKEILGQTYANWLLVIKCQALLDSAERIPLAHSTSAAS